MEAMDLIPDLSHYSNGLGAATFPLRATSHGNKNDSESDDGILTVNFVVVTLENGTAEITMNGQGFRVTSFSPLLPQHVNRNIYSAAESTTAAASSLQPSMRQQEAVSGFVYETIEALLMAISPGFEAFFGQELSRKLENATWDQSRFQRLSDDSADESSDNDHLEDR